MYVQILVMIIVILIFVVLWILYSRRHSTPCPYWLSWLIELDNPFFKINRSSNIIKHLDLKPGMSVLDVGCGPGRLTIPIAHKIGANGEIVAMDIQIEMLDKLRKKVEKENLHNVKFLHSGIGENKLEHNKFDRVIIVTVLGEIPNKEAALNEILNALKPDGILSITEIITDPHFQSKNKVIRLASSVGFNQEKCFGNRLAFTINFKKSPKHD